MPPATFAAFGQALCEAAGATFPDMQRAPDGVMAFHLDFGDVVVDVAHVDAPGNDEVFLLVDFGAVPAQLELPVLRLLLEANFSLLGEGAPSFGRNPDSQAIVLRQRVLLSQADARDTCEAMLRTVELARQWRADPAQAASCGAAVSMPPQGFA